MIKVTKLNGKSYHLNAIFMEMVESNPDTTITMTNGSKYVVRESEQEILQAIHNYYQSIKILGYFEKEDGDDEK
ncbi:MAG: flagellar FlbD family protein [Bacillus sp. (in: firmicutes)]